MDTPDALGGPSSNAPGQQAGEKRNLDRVIRITQTISSEKLSIKVSPFLDKSNINDVAIVA